MNPSGQVGMGVKIVFWFIHSFILTEVAFNLRSSFNGNPLLMEVVPQWELYCKNTKVLCNQKVVDSTMKIGANCKYFLFVSKHLYFVQKTSPHGYDLINLYA